jgi:hypothetical protein
VICIELTRNGTKLAVAGLEGDGVLSTLVTGLARGGEPRNFQFSLGGLEFSGSDKWSLQWAIGPATVGDEFTVRVLELDRCDPPSKREAFETPEQVRQATVAHLERIEAEARGLREQLGLPPR